MNEHISTASSYDSVAAMYHELWADWYLPAALPALERLLFSQIASGARVLDLCCGSGHVTKELVRRGYRVTGVDNSAALIELARRELPGIDLRVCDARDLPFDQQFEAVLSTFDSLNHILTYGDLARAFQSAFCALACGGTFVFDMNLEEAYTADLRQWSVDVKDTRVGLVRGDFDASRKRATTELIWFTREPGAACWRQERSRVEQQCYTQAEILEALRTAGFREVESVPAYAAGVTSELGFGRMYFRARRVC